MGVHDKKDLNAIGHFYLSELDKWSMNDLGADFVYSGSRPIPFMLPNGLKEILDYAAWSEADDQVNKYPLIAYDDLEGIDRFHPKMNFLRCETAEVDDDLLRKLKAHPSFVLMVHTQNKHAMADVRRVFVELMNLEVSNPVIINRAYKGLEEDTLMLSAATDIGGLLIDGLGDGVAAFQLFGPSRKPSG